ncbi:pumilio 12 [Tripterygium wilfordii]|uniref:Pumilio 12 n=1 Tax=Tripterygium wilfordii TaxID=458696 RepID=A0A7J7BUD1_TRIWF|nr:pumilio homolog 12-like [Tripterygium wilfordii]KAF5725532.1 pumilio 12 [Tripterygium wilfordii]
MDGSRTELEFDDIEKLLCEIPNATYGNSHSEVSGVKRASLNDSLVSICENSCEGPFTEKLQNNERLDEGKLLVRRSRQSTSKRVQPEETNLPDDQSLTSAFTDLSLSERETITSLSPHLSNCKSSANNATFLDCRLPNSLENSICNMNSRVMTAPSFQSPNTVHHPLEELTMTKMGQQSSNLYNIEAQEFKKVPIGYYQPVDNLSAVFQPAHEVKGLHLLPNMPFPQVEPAMLSDQHQNFPDRQSLLPYLHSQQVIQPRFSWSNVEEEPYYRMHQQFLYMQQLHNQQFEAHHPLPANRSVPNRLSSRNLRQQRFEVPMTHQFERPHLEPFLNNYGVQRGLSQSTPLVSSSDYNAIRVFDKVARPNYPEKILTRSHGLNTLKAVKFGTVGGHESLNRGHQNGKFLSNGHFRHSLSTPNAGMFHLDSLDSWNWSPDTFDIRSTNMRPQILKYDSVDEMSGRIYHMAKDQNGCRLLQRKFSEGTPEDVEKIFLEIVDHIVELMTDPFGNYLVQKLLEVCSEDQHMKVLQAITRKAGDLIKISCDMHGTRAVQKVIETLTTPEQFSIIVSSLKPGIVTLMKNMNGNHVAQRCLQYLMPEYSEFLFEAATTNCVELATDRHGCCVLQKCLTYSEAEQRRQLVSEITSNALILCQDPFGNYVVQFVFELRLPWATEDILDQLDGNYGDLSMQKYSSNVVEKCLKYAGEENRDRIIRELIDTAHLDQIMQDPYGNYVIQAALHLSKGALHSALMDKIRPHVPVLRTSPYGKKVLSSNGLKK